MIKKLKSSLTAKIFLLTALLLTVCCIATYGFIAWMVPQTYPNQIDLESAELSAYETSLEFRDDYKEHYHFLTEDYLEIFRTLLGNDLELHVFDENGNEVSLSDISQHTDKHISDYDADKRTQEYHFSFADDSSTYFLVYVDGSQAVNQAIEALESVFPYLITMVLCISFLTSFAYSRYITAPIKKINHASQKMAALNFNVKSKTKRTDELGEVSDSLNLLAGKLSTALNELEKTNEKLVEDYSREKQLEKQRTELFSSISHELKTPITIVKGQLQGMIGGIGRYKDKDTYLIQSLEAVTRLENMVQEMLTVSRMEAPDYTCNRKPFDLAALIKQCLTEQEDLFIQKEMELDCDLPQNLIYAGDEQLLKRAFSNVISNALTYSPQGNTIFVCLAEENMGIKFSIENTGVHIDNEDLTRIFEAFYRTEQSRNRQTGGSGLGLYIVKKVLDLHEAQYSMDNTKEGVIFTAKL